MNPDLTIREQRLALALARAVALIRATAGEIVEGRAGLSDDGAIFQEHLGLIADSAVLLRECGIDTGGIEDLGRNVTAVPETGQPRPAAALPSPFDTGSVT